MSSLVRPGNIIWAVIALFLFSCNVDTEKVKFRKYYVAGQRGYEKKCANCHQLDGSGLKGLYPPLNGADFLRERYEDSMCIIKNGAKGEITVNGTSYNLPMPPSNLSNLEIAEIATYLYNSWGINKGLIDVKEVSRITQACKEFQKND